jgi:hypothetical protein
MTIERQPDPPCKGCDHACDNIYNEDGECVGKATPDEREALETFIVHETPKPEGKP